MINNKFLNNSVELLNEIEKYLKNNPRNILPGSEVNVFEYNNNSYLLDEYLCNHIYIYILNNNKESKSTGNIFNHKKPKKLLYDIEKTLNNYFTKLEKQKNTLNYTDKKRPIIRPLAELIDIKALLFASLLDETNYKMISYATTECLAQSMFNFGSTSNQNIFSISQTNLSISLGKAIWTTLFIERFKYLPKKDYHIFKYSNNKLFTYYNRGDCNNMRKILLYTDADISRFKSFHIRQIYINLKSKEDKENFLSIVGINDFISYKNNNELEDIPFYISIGATLINILEEQYILEKTTKERQIYLNVSVIYLDDLNEYSSIYRPAISYNTIKKRKEDNPRFNKIKTSSSFSYKYHNKSAIDNIIKTDDVKYCINRPFFTAYYNYINDIQSLYKINNKDESILEFILIHYDINLKFFLNDKDYIKLVENCLDFSKLINDGIFQKKLKEKIKQKFKLLKKKVNDKNKINKSLEILLNKLNFYEKISSTKYYIITFLKEAYIYKFFNFFYISKHIRYVGRIFSDTVFLSLQSNKFAKAFICYYSDNLITVNNFKQVNNIFWKHTHDSLNEDIKNLSYTQFKKATFELQWDFIKSYFSDCNIDALQIFNVGNIKNSIHHYIENFKDNKNALFALSLLHYQQYKILYKNTEVLCEYDSTTSGLQMISILLRDKNLGILTNLHGTSANNIYIKFLNDFKLTLYDIKIFASNFLESIKVSSDTIQSIYEHNNYLNLLLCNILAFFNIKLNIIENIDIKTFYFLLYKHIPIKENIDFIHELNYDFNIYKYTQLLNSKYLIELEKYNKKNQHIFKFYIHSISIVILDIQLYKIQKEEPLIFKYLNHKTLVKKLIMADPYGITTHTALSSIHEAFQDICFAKGHVISYNHINLIANYMTKYYTQIFRPIHLQSLTKLDKIQAIFKAFQKKEKIPFTMNSKYFKFTNKPLMKITKRICVLNPQQNSATTKKNWLNYNSYTNQIDSEKLCMQIKPFIIHNLDASLATDYLTKMSVISSYLIKIQLSAFYHTNHDCFHTCFSLIFYLKYIIRSSYINLYNQQTIKRVANIFKDDIKDCLEIKKLKKLCRREILNLQEKPYTISKKKLNTNYLTHISNPNCVKF